MQVLYKRPSEWSLLAIDGEQIPIGKEVIQHFRNTAAILNMNCQVRVELVDDEFRDRSQYLQTVLDRIKARPKERGVIFLDPDTGLQPKGKAGHQHVLNAELTSIWDALRNGDILVFYQHKTNRSNEPWIPAKMTQFDKTLGAKPGATKLAHATGIANDVAFFFALKT
jgi:hypothetical protein